MKALREKYLLYKIYSRHDADAYGEIYDLYVKRIFRFIYFKVPSQAEAEDITSEVFLRSWQYLKENKVDFLSALLYQIARNAVMDFYRERAKADFTSDENVLENIEDKRKMGEIAEINADMRQVMKAIKNIKGEYQEVLIMKYLDEMTTKEIAVTIRKKPSTVRVLIHRSLNALRDQIEENNL